MTDSRIRAAVILASVAVLLIGGLIWGVRAVLESGISLSPPSPPSPEVCETFHLLPGRVTATMLVGEGTVHNAFADGGEWVLLATLPNGSERATTVMEGASRVVGKHPTGILRVRARDDPVVLSLCRIR